MTINLDAMSRTELTKLRSDVDKAMATLADRERRAAMAAAEKAAAEYGFSLAELTGGAAAVTKRGKPKSAPKYRNPSNADQTWSGRGRKPGWIVEAESAGRSISDFAI